jgi:archaellum component FlaF (FlaF/FlaG flagellin family)
MPCLFRSSNRLTNSTKGEKTMEHAVVIVPGLSPKRVTVPTAGMRLEEVLSKADILFSNKQTYVDKNGVALEKEDLVFPGDTITVATTVANG